MPPMPSPPPSRQLSLLPSTPAITAAVAIAAAAAAAAAAAIAIALAAAIAAAVALATTVTTIVVTAVAAIAIAVASLLFLAFHPQYQLFTVATTYCALAYVFNILPYVAVKRSCFM